MVPGGAPDHVRVNIAKQSDSSRAMIRSPLAWARGRITGLFLPPRGYKVGTDLRAPETLVEFPAASIRFH
jgi:hypothetical protein